MKKKIVALVMAFGVMIGGFSSGASADFLYEAGSPSSTHSGTYYNVYNSDGSIDILYASDIDGMIMMDKLRWGSSAGTKHTYAKNKNGTDVIAVKFLNRTDDGNDTAGEIMFYLQEYNYYTYTWETVSHFGTYKNTGGWVERKLYTKYGGVPFEPGVAYRLKFSSPNNSELLDTSFAVPSGHSVHD